jgi:uncharacterized protein
MFMGVVQNEPSMEDILSSIRRIIADEDTGGRDAVNGTFRISPAAKSATPTVSIVKAPSQEASMDEEILELTDTVPVQAEQPAQSAATAPSVEPQSHTTQTAEPTMASETKPEQVAAAAPVVSEDSASAARNSLRQLSQVVVRPEAGSSTTLEGLVTELMRPMLKEWLDANLPAIVEAKVQSEIARITAGA